jgi:hypothetical protein
VLLILLCVCVPKTARGSANYSFVYSNFNLNIYVFSEQIVTSQNV